MGGTLSVVSSQPLPELTVKSSAPLPDATKQSPEGTGYWAGVESSLKSMIPDTSSVVNFLKSEVSAGRMFIPALAPKAAEEAAAEGIRRSTRPMTPDKGIGYRAANAASPLVPGLNPESMEGRAEKGDTAGILGEASVPLATTAATVGGGKLAEALPSADRAAAALADVKATAGHVPIDMSEAGATALELYTQSQRGATLPKVVRDFVNRATKPGSDPITYGEAKDFQSNVSALSVDEKMSLKPNTKRLLGQLNSDLKASLEDAADTQGKGQQFSQAMTEYHHAMQLKGFSEAAIKAGIAAAVNAAGIVGVKKIWDSVGTKP